MLRKQSKLPVDDLNALKANAVEAYRAAVERANPFTAVQTCIKKNGVPTPKNGGQTLVIGVGKAAPAMIKGLRELLDGPNKCICITHKENGENVENCEMFKAGHCLLYTSPSPRDRG